MIQMTLFQLAAEGARRLEESGSPDAGNDARQLLMAAFHLDMAHFLLDRMQPLPDSGKTWSAIRRYQEMIEQRRGRIPLQQILGVQEFMGLEFYVNRHVLIPRQDTETLVELVLKEHRAGDSLLDLCTGSGCIAISLALKGQFTSVTATDISGEALEVAKRNAEKLLGAVKAEKAASEAAEPGKAASEVAEPGKAASEAAEPEKAASEAAEPGIIGQEREEPEKEGLVFRLCQGDLFEALPRTASGDTPRYDIITANPPYIPTDIIPTLEPEVRDHEPVLALDGTRDGVYYYRRIAQAAGAYLTDRGRIYVEIGHDQGTQVSAILRDQGYQHIRVIKDLAGNDRVVSAAVSSYNK